MPLQTIIVNLAVLAAIASWSATPQKDEAG